jgi:hypothetical protein
MAKSPVTSASSGARPGWKLQYDANRTQLVLELYRLLRDRGHSGSEAYLEERIWYLQNLLLPYDPYVNSAIVEACLMVDQAFEGKPYTLPFVNPTKKVINIEPLGLGKSTLSPSEKAEIPIHMTLGRKKSAVEQVAPQLIRDSRDYDSLLDLTPVEHEEWIGYVQEIKCYCKRFKTWQDKPACPRCKEQNV